MGVGLAPSQGQKKGVVVDIEATVEAVKAAVEEAELTAGVSVDRAWLGATGSHLWTTSPTPPSGEYAWFLVVGNDGDTTEGGWGTDSSGTDRSTAASGQCGSATLDLSACLP